MSIDHDEIIEVFKKILAAVLFDGDLTDLFSRITDDVTGIGMGSQGIVHGREDVKRILAQAKANTGATVTRLDFRNMEVRCYEERYGTICCIVQITAVLNGKIAASALGQLMNFRKVAGTWMVYTMQATPVFEQIEDMEAYPLKFAENILESYRQQEQIAKSVQSDCLGTYVVNYEKGIFESAVLKSDILINAHPGDPYEKMMFEAARKYLRDDDGYRFISTFSLGNILNAYQSGQMELSMEYEMRVSDNTFIWLKTIVKLYMGNADQTLKGCLYVVDIDSAKQKELELQCRVELDPMTKIYNKFYVEKKISEKLKRRPLLCQGAFFMIDLDYFKNINDTYGHQEGDRIISEAAKCIKTLIRKEDIAGRVGGDEFCIYFQSDMTRESIEEKAQTLCRCIRKIFSRKEHGSSCSIGIVQCRGAKETFDELYRKADRALYQQKRNGRNGYTIYTDDMEAPAML